GDGRLAPLLATARSGGITDGRHVLRIGEKRLINQPHCIVLVADTTKQDRYLRQLDGRQGILSEAILYKFDQRTILIEVAQAPSNIHGN
ncbi:hypothetical protein, partial [Xanthomonas citri]